MTHLIGWLLIWKYWLNPGEIELGSERNMRYLKSRFSIDKPVISSHLSLGALRLREPVGAQWTGRCQMWSVISQRQVFLSRQRLSGPRWACSLFEWPAEVARGRTNGSEEILNIHHLWPTSHYPHYFALLLGNRWQVSSPHATQRCFDWPVNQTRPRPQDLWASREGSTENALWGGWLLTADTGKARRDYICIYI